MKKKIIVAIADGLGDRPIQELGNLSPLQYANTPHLDQLASEGRTGLMDPIHPGITVGTDMGHTILFGHSSSQYPGRGPIEAAGVGLILEAGDIAFRCNFATVNDEGIVVDRRAGRIRQRTDELAQAINGYRIEDVEFLFKEATEHRAVLVMRGQDLSANISDSDPKAPNDGSPYKKVRALDSSPQAKRTAELLNRFLVEINQVLINHPVNIERQAKGLLPANFILTRGSGMMTEISHLGKDLGFTCAVVAGEDTVLGMAHLSGYDLFRDPSFTGNIDTNIELKARYALKAIRNHDLVYVHLKATDVMGHDNNPKGKVRAIEKFDKLLKLIMDDLPQNTLVALCADHSTPCEKGEHSGEPVPILIHGPGIFSDPVSSYDEVACSQGGLGRLTGHEFIWSLLDYLEVIPKQGN
ncbi:2,3-bisphosphoglycerate-independent phosphoglycerate mutase [Ignavigranum ruoffiae]|uniref:2,3-bisphosphoglycerate-independent phosphoglycerate mutase n=1 Tax=Ignavigranum ruoffiae TaxID=89093 RepID=UPI0024AE5FEA|nr:2,3-bisphosphoglycerate-independent phosphoglycerate mutase [Ignavigranum ruoffiae]